jgi:DNA primase small subunit
LWISDKEAMELTDDERKAAVDYLTIVTGGKELKKKVNVRQGAKQLPPSVKFVLVS